MFSFLRHLYSFPSSKDNLVLIMDTLSSAAEIVMGWEQAWRAPAIAPVLRWTVAVCLAMSIMVLVDRVYMGIVIMGVKLSIEEKGCEKVQVGANQGRFGG